MTPQEKKDAYREKERARRERERVGEYSRPPKRSREDALYRQARKQYDQSGPVGSDDY